MQGKPNFKEIDTDWHEGCDEVTEKIEEMKGKIEEMKRKIEQMKRKIEQMKGKMQEMKEMILTEISCFCRKSSNSFRIL